MSHTTENATRQPGRQQRFLLVDPVGPDTSFRRSAAGTDPAGMDPRHPLLTWLESLGGELAAMGRRLAHPPLDPEELGSLPAAARRGLESLEESVVNAHTAARQLISLLSPADETRETLNPDQLWLILRSTLQVSGRRNLRLQWDRDAASGWLDVNMPALLGALQELLRNAMEAMPDGGILSIHQQEIVLTASELAGVRRGWPEALDGTATSRPGRPGRAFLCLRVNDTGYGIPAQLMSRVLAGGYSTHTGREGRGLERARNVIEGLQGHLLIHSHVGSGTTASVLLPLQDLAPVEHAPTALARQRVQTGKGRVLLAEDDTGIRETTAEILERLGYTVECARDGEDALRRVDEAHAPFDLVILDLVMPVLGGMETLGRLRAQDPHLPVLMITGFMMDEEVDSIARIWGVPVIQKPFKLADFSRQVAQRMAGDSRGDRPRA